MVGGECRRTAHISGPTQAHRSIYNAAEGAGRLIHVQAAGRGSRGKAGRLHASDSPGYFAKQSYPDRLQINQVNDAALQCKAITFVALGLGIAFKTFYTRRDNSVAIKLKCSNRISQFQ